MEAGGCSLLVFHWAWASEMLCQGILQSRKLPWFYWFMAHPFVFISQNSSIWEMGLNFRICGKMSSSLPVSWLRALRVSTEPLDQSSGFRTLLSGRCCLNDLTVLVEGGDVLGKLWEIPVLPLVLCAIGKYAFVFLFPSLFPWFRGQAFFPCLADKTSSRFKSISSLIFLDDSNGLSLCYKIVGESWDVQGAVPSSSSCCVEISRSNPRVAKVGQEVPVVLLWTGAFLLCLCAFQSSKVATKCSGWKGKRRKAGTYLFLTVGGDTGYCRTVRPPITEHLCIEVRFVFFLR